MPQVQNMFAEAMETPVSEILPDTNLQDLGVDSLMITEVANEITNRFGITVPISELQDLQDVHALASRLQSHSTKTHSKPINGHAGYSSSAKTNGVSQMNGHSTPRALNGESRPNSTLTADESFQKVRRNYDTITKITRFSDFCRDVYPTQMELVTAYVVEAFTKLGCPLAELRMHENVPEVPFLDVHAKLKRQLYRILEEGGLIQRDTDGGTYLRTDIPTPSTPSNILHNDILNKFPQHVSEHKLLNSTGSKLAECLVGTADPLGILFGSPKARLLMEEVYTNAPMFKADTIQLAQYLVHVFDKIDDSSRVVRILELGAGTGGTTKHLVEMLVGQIN